MSGNALVSKNVYFRVGNYVFFAIFVYRNVLKWDKYVYKCKNNTQFVTIRHLAKVLMPCDMT